MASFQTLAIILVGLLLIVSLFYNSSKSKNSNKGAGGSIPKYYLKPMVKYWRKTLKLFLHFSGVRKTEWSEITVDDLFDRINSNQPPLLIDLRSPAEFNGTDELTSYGHIPNARSIPVLELESNLEDLESFKEKEIVTMCPGGGMSLVAVEILTEAGFKDVKSLTGGTDLWHKKGYPTTTA
jgi:rhodanese-related sulfurtransferase